MLPILPVGSAPSQFLLRRLARAFPTTPSGSARAATGTAMSRRQLWAWRVGCYRGLWAELESYATAGSRPPMPPSPPLLKALLDTLTQRARGVAICTLLSRRDDRRD